jgi:hypothetical protein
MEPGTMDLILHKRKGFIKIALTTGFVLPKNYRLSEKKTRTSLVPVICFGDNDAYGRYDNVFFRTIAAFTLKLGGFLLPINVKGRWGLPLPNPAKLVTVGKLWHFQLCA